jgi:hypothetical protein
VGRARENSAGSTGWAAREEKEKEERKGRVGRARNQGGEEKGFCYFFNEDKLIQFKFEFKKLKFK